MDEMVYKGYVIRAVPYELADSGEWTVTIHIEKHTGDQVASRPFSASNRFKTRQEAIQHCFAFGQQIIDGRVASCTIADL